MQDSEKYLQAASIAKQIADELKSLNRWSDHPLPEEKLQNMGAFGSNTMSFEQWIQFVLLPRLHEIISSKGEFPPNSSIAVYGVRAFDGDDAASNLQDLLRQLDDLANETSAKDFETEGTFIAGGVNETVTIDSTEIPTALLTVIELLPKFSGEDLESQLQTIDIFLNVLHSSVRTTISSLMQNSANEKIIDSKVKERILNASKDVANGNRAAAPYNHEEAMKMYLSEHKKNFN